MFIFFFSSRRRHTILQGDWSSDVCSSDLFAERGVPLSVLSRPFRRRLPPPDPSLSDCSERASACPETIKRRSEERRVGKECRSGRSKDNRKERKGRGIVGEKMINKIDGDNV